MYMYTHMYMHMHIYIYIYMYMRRYMHMYIDVQYGYILILLSLLAPRLVPPPVYRQGAPPEFTPLHDFEHRYRAFAKNTFKKRSAVRPAMETKPAYYMTLN